MGLAVAVLISPSCEPNWGGVEGETRTQLVHLRERLEGAAGERGSVRGQRILEQWVFDSEALPEGVDVQGRASFVHGAGVRVEPSEGELASLRLSLGAGLAARSANTVIVRSKADSVRRGGQGRIYWRRDGEAFDERRSMAYRIPPTRASRFRAYSVVVSGHELWAGDIVELQIVPFSELAPVHVTNILIGQTKASTRAALAKRSRSSISVGGVVLDSVQVRVPSSRRCRVQVPEGGRLETAFALLGAELPPGREVRFSVTARVAEDRRELFAESLAARPERWIRREVDLPRSSGEIELEFRVDARGEAPLPGVEAVWGAPVIIAERPGAEQPSFLVVSLDTLRPDHLSLYGYEKRTSPSLDELARQAHVFERAYCQAPGTLASHSSLFTSTYSGESDGFGHKGLEADSPTLASMLREAGYFTAAVTDGGYMASIFGLSLGFDVYDDRAGGVEPVFGRALELLANVGGRPFFLFLHTYEIHTPYRAPAEFRRALSSGWEDLPEEVTSEDLTKAVDEGRADAEFWRDVVALYDAGILYTDSWMGVLLDALKANGLSEDVIVIVLSDHGEDLGERGGSEHGDTLFEEQIRVPLLIHVPERWRHRLGLESSGRISSVVELVDVLPTIAELAGIDPVEDTDGESLVPILRGREGQTSPAVAGFVPGTHEGFAVVGDRWKYLTFDGNEEVDRCRVLLENGDYLFDLEGDPVEEHNLVDEALPVGRRLREYLDDIQERWGEASAESGDRDLDEKTRRELQRLGYIK